MPTGAGADPAGPDAGAADDRGRPVGDPPRVALVGANGHGRWHRRAIAPLHAAGRLRLVALVDVRPLEDEPTAPVPPDARVLTDHRAMLAATRPDVVVVCTPPHTHLPIALDVLDAGADLLLEKPPVLDLAEHRALAAASAATRRAVQVGFQALGSAALTELTDALAAGRLGRVTGIATVAAWQRPDAYYARSPWAGRRSLGGRPALDGALANPLAHAVMQCLAVVEAVAGAPAAPERIEVERYRVRPIEVDDTAVLRVTPRGGPPVLAAVTLAGEDFIAGEVLVTGERGRALLEYPTDRLRLPGDPGPRAVPGRRGLLENLLDHRAAGTPLIAPVSRTAPFTAVLDALRSAPEPTLLGGDLVRRVGDGPERVRVIRGVDAVLRAAAETGALPSEAGVPWAVRPYVVDGSDVEAPQR
ncbi:Gfo/Idh/MocA family oxidoreductase [Micromonospora sp. PPF5-17]|uniref:Gfo/Idh/MocA family oxidoreductase n=1 Tax=Micromonospora solifontis TaxID=2487138 RepID=A0ABX9WDW4_9ACTN|nr:Gfo/Idh/MocA family oxidoreductase [Micromonospora sp. PPF5-17B]NES38637.1 Gfo/Idh/MocA family oxidoreductase [Micromonospora solifontis]NES54921.1 Gfo/Idh/MocA family oxidoreductase [Micromonospora sp. PPF5-6]RNL94456.1 gfo/Idh/MocA family oxidoreductase [Micromonospora solifontis]